MLVSIKAMVISIIDLLVKNAENDLFKAYMSERGLAIAIANDRVERIRTGVGFNAVEKGKEQEIRIR